VSDFLRVIVVFVLVLVGGPRQYRFLIHPSTNWFSAYVVAPVLFCVWVGWLRVQNRAFAWLGRISYSIYLFHHVVMIPLFSWVAWESNAALRGGPLPLYLIVTLLVIPNLTPTDQPTMRFPWDRE
jgi:peptidoglycan/LPS O-acetylase OafA/YrhL